MNFFQQQDEARSRTTRLLVLFGAALVGITLTIYAALVLVSPFASGRVDELAASGSIFEWWQPQMLGACAFGVFGLVGFATFLKIKSLGEGGSAVAESVGGRRIAPGTTDPREKRLLNVVEEMAIASGLPVPAVYVLPDETGINAFAAGYEPADAAVAVTRGTLHVLNRAELQAVIAHEFSHILNGDMRLNVRLIGVLFGLMMIGNTGWWLFRLSAGSFNSRGFRRRNDGVPVVALAGLALAVIGAIGVFFGRLLQRAVSRQREYLADASAVQFTRDSTALAGALKKIGGYGPAARVRAREASELSHLFFGEAIGSGVAGLLATHPPLDERIRRIDPSFDGRFPAVPIPDSLLTSEAPTAPAVAGLTSHAHAMSMALPGTEASFALHAPDVVADVGSPTPDHLAWSTAMVGSIPTELREAARSGLGAVALTYALLLDPSDREHANRQLSGLRATTHPDIFAEVLRLAPFRHGLDPRTRLPLVELAIAGLRQLSPDQYGAFRDEVSALVTTDGRLSLFEFAVQKSLVHWLDGSFGLRERRPVQYYAIRAIKDELSVVLSVLAYVGHTDSANALNAFHRGSARFRLLAPGDVRFLSPAECGFDRLDTALTKLGMASPALKAQLIDACAHCVVADQQVAVDEAELLRVIADAVDCPLPPFLPTARGVA